MNERKQFRTFPLFLRFFLVFRPEFQRHFLYIDNFSTTACEIGMRIGHELASTYLHVFQLFFWPLDSFHFISGFWLSTTVVSMYCVFTWYQHSWGRGHCWNKNQEKFVRLSLPEQHEDEPSICTIVVAKAGLRCQASEWMIQSFSKCSHSSIQFGCYAQGVYSWHTGHIRVDFSPKKIRHSEVN